MTLPRFTENAVNTKCAALTGVSLEPEPFVVHFLETTQTRLGVARSELRILDMGCGRGDRVAWLCSNGWDAFGADIRADYVANGRRFLEQQGLAGERLRAISERTLPFDAGAFDVVLSDQVLEHVGDLSLFAEQVAFVSAPNAGGLHVFPARWRPIEPHMKTPFIHWIPKGRARQLALSAALRCGLSADYFEDYATSERALIFGRFSEEETFYRSLAAIRQAFTQVGLNTSFARPTTEKLHMRIPALPVSLLRPAALCYRHLMSVYVQTVWVDHRVAVDRLGRQVANLQDEVAVQSDTSTAIAGIG